MSNLKYTVNLGNSIIGVSIIAMPYCFKKCGIVLSIILIILSNLFNRLSCHLLMKSAILSRRKNYELLAFHTFGSKGKLVVELGVLGFLIGTCVAFFVVIGDIGPALVSEIFGIPNGPELRALIMTFLGMFVALPLGLLRRVDSLTSFSMLSLGLYVFLIIKMFTEASSSLSTNSNIWDKVNYWDTSCLLSNLPIFSMALSCQTQLFEIFDHSLLDDLNAMKRMNKVVRRAINICSLVYISVGYFGYIAFYHEPFQGNILLFLSPGFISTLTKVAFVFTVVISFPLCLFPCRTSLHSLLFKKSLGTLANEGFQVSTSSSIHMSDRHFRLLTILLIITTIGISVLLPRIELVLGILGSTIGTIICLILPAAIFLQLTEKNTNERLSAHFIGFIGVFILIGCSYSNLHNIYLIENKSLIQDINSNYKTNNLKVLPSKIPLTLTTKFVNNLDLEAIKKEDKEMKSQIELDPPKKPVPADLNKLKRQEELLQRLEKQQQEHKKLIEQQKEILSEMKKHEKSHQVILNNSMSIQKNSSNIKTSVISNKKITNLNKTISKISNKQNQSLLGQNTKEEKNKKIFDATKLNNSITF